jgi:hypothetical protein
MPLSTQPPPDEVYNEQQPVEGEQPPAEGEQPSEQPSDLPAGLLRSSLDPENAWQDRVIEAVNGLYPRLRNGVDYAIGRRSPEGEIELLETAPDVNIDWGKVVEGAKHLAEANPYSDYHPRAGLAPPRESGADQGEEPRTY